MTDLGAQPRHWLAARAGVDVGTIDRLIELGVVGSDEGGFGEGTVRRVRLAQMLEAAGVPLEGLAEVVRQGALTLDFVESEPYERFASYGAETFREVAERTGVPLDLLMVIREVSGSAPPAPNDRLRDDESAVVPLLEVQLAGGFRPATLERVLRVYGDSLRRMAETEADAWRSDLVAPRLAAGASWRDIAAHSEDFGTVLAPYTDATVRAIFRAHQGQAWMRTILEGVESILATAGIRGPDRHPPAVGFLDMTGYTRLTEEHGDEAAAALAVRLARTVQRIATQRGGKVVKWLGDGVMSYFPQPEHGVTAALEMIEVLSGAGLPPARVGLHAGPVLYQEGDYFGRTVNIASRLADFARPGEVVVSEAVVAAVVTADVSFHEIGPVELKGVAGTMRVHIAARAG